MSRDKVQPGQPDENTSLLGDGDHNNSSSNNRYEAITGGGGRPMDIEAGDTEHDALLGPSSSGQEEEEEEEDDDNSGSTNGNGNGTSNGATADATAPRRYLVNTNPARFRLVFSGIMLTYFMASVDSTILASSHPVITSHFRAANMASWLTTAFMLTATAFQPFVGRLSDSLGRKPLYIATVTLFAIATLWCALAGSIASFIAARAVCGLGAGGMMTLGAISISDLVPIEQRGTYQSIINIIYGISAASGAAFGGLLADTLGWRWEFGIQIFPLVLSLAAAIYAMPPDLGLQSGQKRQSLAEALRGFDFKGSVLLTSSTTFLILGLNLGGNVLPWSHPLIITSLSIFAVCFPTCLYVESHVEKPIMPLVLLRSFPRANIIFANTIASFILNAILFNVPLFFRAALLKTATESGLYLVVPTIVASITGATTGLLITRHRYITWPLISGAVLFLFSTALLSAMRPGWPTWAYLGALVPFSVAQGFQFPGTFIAVLAASPHAEQAVVTTTLHLWRALGNVLGVACSSLVFQNALLRYLVAYVSIPADQEHGEAWKAALIERVRSSIEAISDLPDGPTKDQVVSSYAAASRAAFLSCLVFSVVAVLLILPVRLPRLGKK